ncbi:MAG: peptide chain release factor N(5)-glutamine methyltransferase [Rhodoferax sp.]|nr:peptide chain release factor N(5)-glutamine methyltransferase [Rhodoferax sp.]
MEAQSTVGHALQSAMALGVARLEAQLLLLHALGRTVQERAWLLAHGEEALSIAAQQIWQEALARRMGGEPLPYITGWAAFYGLELQVDARVLCPRADTETLVEWALKLLPVAARAIDLGTGSGAIALALKQQRPDVHMDARDLSAEALAVAQANAQRLGLDIAFSQGAWLEGLAETFDFIVSNPPYIADADPHLAALTHEPLQALTSGADGLDDLRAIIAQAPACLKPDGWLLLEHGYDQAEAVRQLLQAKGFVDVQSRQDLAGIERCSGGRWFGP